MMTIGDVLAALSLLMAFGFGWGATLLTAALAFPARTRQAAQAIAGSPGRCLLRGLGVFVVVGVVAISLNHNPAGPVRLLGAALWVCLALLAAVGSAGIARLLADRIQSDGTALTPFAALTRAAMLLVLAGFVPIIGWFLVTPLVTFAALGSLVRPLSRQSAPAHPASSLPEPGAAL